MASIRDKLKALYAGNPTALPEGAPTEAAPASEPVTTTPKPHRAKRVTTPAKPPTSSPSPPASPSPATPRQKPVARSKEKTAPPRSQQHVHAVGQRPSTVVRSGDFAAWKARRGTLEEVPRPLDTPPPAIDSDSATLSLRAGKAAQARGDSADAKERFKAALASGLSGTQWWSAARGLANAYLASNDVEAAIPLLEEMVETPNADPFPYLKLASLVEDHDPERAEGLRARARAIAPWL